MVHDLALFAVHMYLIKIFTMQLFSEGGLSLPRFLHESIQVMTLRNYEIDALCDFRLLHLLADLGSIPDIRKLKSGMLPKFAKR